MGHEWRCMDPIENGDIPASYVSLLEDIHYIRKNPGNSGQNLLELKNDPHVCKGKKNISPHVLPPSPKWAMLYIASKFYLRGCLWDYTPEKNERLEAE